MDTKDEDSPNELELDDRKDGDGDEENGDGDNMSVNDDEDIYQEQGVYSENDEDDE